MVSCVMMGTYPLYGIVSVKRDLTHALFQDSNKYSRSLKCPLHIAFYALRIEVSIMELYGSEFLISHTYMYQHISNARTGNVCTRSLFARTIPHALL